MCNLIESVIKHFYSLLTTLRTCERIYLASITAVRDSTIIFWPRKV